MESPVEPGRIGEFFLSILERFDEKPVIFPTSDFFVKIIATHFSEIREKCLVYPHNGTLGGNITDKEEQIKHAIQAGIPVPRTIFVSSGKGLAAAGSDFPYPALLKGADSTDWARYLKSGKGIFIKTFRDLQGAVDRVIHYPGKLMLQEAIPGRDTNLFEYCVLMNKQKEIVASFIVEKVRQYPGRFGVGSVVVSRLNSEVDELGTAYFRTMGFSGIGQIELKYDERDKCYKFIELNPRLWLQNSLAERCGINFPFLAYNDLAGNGMERKIRFDEGIKWIDFKMDYLSYRGYREEGTLGFGAWMKSLRGQKVYSIFSVDDPVPFLKSLLFDMKVLE